MTLRVANLASSAFPATVTDLTVTNNLTLSAGTANGVLYLNGSKVVTSGSALTFDGTNLGIGTSSPGARLDVSGADGVRARVVALAGGTPGLILSSSGNTAYTIKAGNADNSLRIDQDGNDRITLASGGNLGIGTINPGAKLHINTGGNAATGGILLQNGSNQQHFWYLSSNTVSAFEIGSSIGQWTWTNSNGEAMRLNSTGLGIGTNNPGTTLEISKGSGSSPNLSGTSGNFAITQPGLLTSLQFGGYGSSPFALWIQGQNKSGTAFPIALNPAGGNVGIGTDSPATKLHVNTASGDSKIRISSGANALTIGWDNPNGFYYTAAGSEIQAWQTGGSTRMTLDASGNLGLGVTPSAWSGLASTQIFQANRASFFGYLNEARMSANLFYNGSDRYIASDFATSYLQQSGKHVWYTAASGTAGTAITFTQAMTLDSSGNWVVGSTNPDPFGRNDERRAAIVGGGSTDNVALSISAGASAGRGAQIYLGQTSTRHFTLSANVSESTLGTVSNTPVRFTTNDTERARIDANGNFVVNTAAIATNATNGFLYVPTCAGTPTGTPTTYTGRSPIVVDTTNNKLYFYSGGQWRDAGP